MSEPVKLFQFEVLDSGGCVIGEVTAVGSDEAKAQAYLDFGAEVFDVAVVL